MEIIKWGFFFPFSYFKKQYNATLSGGLGMIVLHDQSMYQTCRSVHEGKLPSQSGECIRSSILISKS